MVVALEKSSKKKFVTITGLRVEVEMKQLKSSPRTIAEDPPVP